MRPSNRTALLDAALRVVERSGVTGITFESVAAEAGLTRGGMLYHFPSREALLLGIHEHLAQQWETQLIRIAGKPAHEASVEERFSAYVKASAQGGASRVELQLMLEGMTHPDLSVPWSQVMARWLPLDQNAAQQADLWIVLLAADGLWLQTSLSNPALSGQLGQRITQRLLDMIAPGMAAATAQAAPSSPRKLGKPDA